MLKDPAVITYMKQKDPNPNVIFMLIDSETEELCQKKGLKNWGTTSYLYSYLGNKVKMVDLLIKSEIPFIPNIRSKIDSYQHLLQLTEGFNTPKIVVQDQDGCGGYGTFAISSENDYKALQSDL
jgi:biotin carboxylase